ncbi:MAG: flagellar basal body rod protein FlgB [Pseudomonadota bacterium]|nr:flagellar basal body rod protein FlgB [Pseudomonadota bacterium]
MAATDALFGVQAQAMDIQRRRMELIAANLANADTPNFKARDLDFRQVLAQAAATANPASTTTAATDAAALKYRIPAQPSADGNTVDVQTEQAQFAESALRYQASLGFLDSRIRSMMTALTGQ